MVKRVKKQFEDMLGKSESATEPVADDDEQTGSKEPELDTTNEYVVKIADLKGKVAGLRGASFEWPASGLAHEHQEIEIRLTVRTASFKRSQKLIPLLRCDDRVARLVGRLLD